MGSGTFPTAGLVVETGSDLPAMRSFLAIFLLVGLSFSTQLRADDPSVDASPSEKGPSPPAVAQPLPVQSPRVPVGNADEAPRPRPVRLPKTWQGSLDDELTAGQRAVLRSMTWMTYVWFFAVGASVGSFANVVAYRVPLGMSVAWPPSRCSSCGQRIRLLDNIPIVSWLRLGGRCRNCAAPFSIRYLLVELAFGLMFVAFGHRELLSGGANLPNWPVPAYTGPVWILWYPKWTVILITLFHIRLVSHLYVWSLAQWDGLRLPPSHRFGDVAVALMLPALLPCLHTVELFQGVFPGEGGPTWANASLVWTAELRLPDWLARSTGAQFATPTFSCDQLAVGLVGAALTGGLTWCCTRVAGLSKQRQSTRVDWFLPGSLPRVAGGYWACSSRVCALRRGPLAAGGRVADA